MDSDPIEVSPLDPNSPRDQPKLIRKKPLCEIYDSLKIPYAPSYFTTLLHPHSNPRFNSTSKNNIMDKNDIGRMEHGENGDVTCNQAEGPLN